MRSVHPSRVLALAGSLTIGISSLAFPALAADRVEVGGVSGSPATVNGVEGYNVSYDRYLYDKIQFLNVVAYYRAYYNVLLNQELQGGAGLDWGAGEHHLETRGDNLSTSANFNQDTVRNVVSGMNIGGLYNYLAPRVGNGWQSQVICLIDADTGRIVGNYGCGNSYEARAVMESVVAQGGSSGTVNTNVNFVDGGTKNLNLHFAGSSVWSSPIILDLSGTGKPDLLAGIESRGFLLTAPLALLVAAVAKTFERNKWIYDATSPAVVEASKALSGTVSYTDAAGRERQLKQVQPATLRLAAIIHGITMAEASLSSDIPDRLVLAEGETEADLAARLPPPDAGWLERLRLPAVLVDVTEADGLGTTECTAKGLAPKPRPRDAAAADATSR